ncbi:dTDP-4-dehydrorhamnose reductase [Luteibacter jiangsuensis]|uniref:dTDP-4-dehydrorhamnose reductase n=1 Tax=Luteibacter jiangsuensis TaxID=637577 RepID=A0ABT9T037_9GAMM|nr:dTDP-4-dehydrorhamnose reductase [Luteibacter jiangsuensis]MDQ0010625.1 dTDP-4-dehydrorhamnose reductase [Luteibacter jiangsuensis]
MKILLLGADGQLGGYLRGALATAGTVRASSRLAKDEALRCDLADLAAVDRLLRRERADLVVNAAAYTAVDQAEGDEPSAMLINATLPAVIGAVTSEWNGAVIHYSTDYVFDGTARHPYSEDDDTAPLGVYGRSKLAGERALEKVDVDHLILRTAWVYSLHGRNFLTTMLRLGVERKQLAIVNDQHGTPTSAGFLATATAQVARKWMKESQSRHKKRGVYHLTATGETTWHGFANAIFDEAVASRRLQEPPTVLPIDTTGYPTPAERPAWSVLDTTRIATSFGVTPPDWRDDLHVMMSGGYEPSASA